MNYSHMKVFYTVVKHQNISKAAEELKVTQPALSRIISTLEKDNKIKLFTRNKNGVTLTSEGLTLYEMIKEPFTDLEKVEEALKDSANFTKKVVHIGATAIALSVYLFKYLENLKSRFPHVTFRIYTNSSSNLLKLVNKKEVDFAFVTTPFKVSSDVKVKNVYKLENVLVAPLSYKEKLKGKISIKSISNYPFVLLNNEMQFREHLNEYFRKNNVEINPVYEPDSSSILLQFVENDCGLTFIPKDMALAAVKENKCVLVDLIEKVPLRYVSFVFNTKYHHSTVVHDICEEITSKHTL